MLARKASARPVHGQAIAGFKSILALISLTKGSRETLSLALALAGEHGSRLAALHIIDPSMNLPTEELGASRRRILGLLRRDAMNEMTHLVRLANPKIPISIIVREGCPRTVVRDAVQDLGSDVIVTCAFSTTSHTPRLRIVSTVGSP